MRCLYCGKELALLKRWTSGGEFCSDAHRQQYQEEYNQLALNRLLQAKPQAKPQEPKPQEAKLETKAQEVKTKPEPRLQENAAQKPLSPPEPPKPAVRPAPLPEPKPEPEPQPAANAIKEEPAPAEAGFFIELPVPLVAGSAELVVAQTDFERHRQPTLPYLREASEAGQWRTELMAAGQLALVPSFVLADSPARVSEGKLELREFVRPAPVVDFDLRTAGATGISETSEEPMDMIIFPQPPPGEPPLWQESERSFPFETELGALARMAFRTTGIEDNEDGEVALPSQAAAPVENVEPALASPPTPVNHPVEAPAAQPPQAIPVRIVNEPSRPSTPVIMKPASPPVFRPAARPAAQAAPVAQTRVAQAPAAPPPAQAAAVKAKPEAIPEAPAKPLPVTLHGLAAGRGKPVQVFASAVAAEVDLQLPRSSALPLRPVMTLGAAPAIAKEIAVKETREERKPAERTVTVKPDPRRQPSRPDPRFTNGKGRKPEPEPQREKFEEPKVAAVATAVKEPEPVQVKEPPKENFPAPVAKPFSPPDLDLPSLTLNTGGGFWGKLPAAGKAGIGVVGVLAIAGIVFAVSRGSNPKPVSEGPHIVEGPALSAVESGWITDWGAEAGVRREHEISVLRPSQNLTDYRLQFEAQIDTKALGWVYRAQDGKNYYVNKLEIVKPGLQPTIALVRFAVINGVEQPRAQFPLTLPVHLDTLYKIRFDAVGDRFITYVQEQKVDEWTDDRLKMGGVGLYNERNERMSLKGTVNVVPLVIKK